MECIEITGVPLGDAPEEVRKAWVGLRLALAATSHGSLAERSIGILSRAPSPGGYVVSALDAVEILRLFNNVAATWWDEHTDFVQPGKFFTFDVVCCRIVTGLPNITAEWRQGMKIPTVGKFLEILNAKATETESWLVSWEYLQRSLVLSLEERLELERSALTVPTVLLIAAFIAWNYWIQIEHTSSPDLFETFHTKGHAALQSLHRHAAENGVQLSLDKVDRTLSITDGMVRAGIIKIIDGGVELTLLGKAEAEAVRRQIEGGSTS